MGYTYRLSGNTEEKKEELAAYHLDSLNGMTTYQLREICQKERLVVPMGSRMEREELIRFIMRYRGIREYRHIADYAEEGIERLQDCLDKVTLLEEEELHMAYPAHLVIYEDEGIELTDHYEVSGNFPMYEGNLLLVDEQNRIYTCMYLRQGEGGNFYLLKGKTVSVRPTENHKFFLLYFRYRESEMIPSVIGVAGVADEKPVYRFGFEARHLAALAYHDEDCPVFYDIKRWVSAPDREQEVITGDGIKIRIPRKEMLSAFLSYLIYTAQQQFKCRFSCIQFLTPVRQKARFEELLRELLPDYRVECALDEGMAVLFHSINELILSGRYTENVWYQALIMDCGGGTTDLTAGKFRIRNNRVSYEIDLETGYENGNTNFGGNNLTFRILQLLKLKLLESLGENKFQFEAGFSFRDREAATRLDRLYEEAESFLPTRFAEYERRSREEYFRVKNNYYYLFGIAETIKESFFQKALRYELKTGCGEEVPLDKWRISVRERGRLVSCKRDFSVLFYLYEIENLLRLDIYELMSRFLEKPFINGELAEYGMLKLTGQSCKSSLFTEALKEFVPGRLIRNERDLEHGSELKMCCLEGAISYFKNLKLGYMKINQKYRVNALPYEVTAYTHENQEKILIHSLRKEQDIGCISRFKIGEQLDLYLRDETGCRLTSYHFGYDVAAFFHVTQEDFNEQYTGTVIQEETDIIVEGEIKFFVWPAKDRWGFIVLPVLRENELLQCGEETFFAFEDDTWEENFFDGRK